MPGSSTTFRVCQVGEPTLRETLVEVAELPRLLTTMLRSMIDAWPRDVYREGLVETRFLGRRTVFVSDPRLIRTLLVDEAASLAREDFMLRALVPALGQGMLTADGGAWRSQRQAVAPMFRPDRIRAFVPAMIEAAEATRRRWSAFGASEPAVDILPEMMRTAFDIIVATMVSGDPGFDAPRFGRAIETYLGQTSWKVALTMLGAPEWMPHPGSRAGAAAAREMREAVGATLARRRADPRPARDLIGLLLEARDPATGAPLADESLIDNLLTFVAAGHETTALAMTWTLRLLSDHPAIERRVLDEIAGVDLADGAAAIDRLVYTRQVVMEAMRLFPPAPLIVRQVVRDIRLGSTRIPAGCSVHVPVYALHRHASLWDRPEAFDPDRFAPAAHAARDRYTYMPFGAGPRVCIGMGLAMMECVAVLAVLLPAFRLRAARPGPIDARFRVTLRPQGGMPMIVRPRHG